MKARIKLVLGVTIAAVAVMTASKSILPEVMLQAKLRDKNSVCYSETEVRILMKSNDWTEQEAKIILDMACQFSRRSK